MDNFPWAALDRVKGYEEPEEAVAYYISGLRHEKQGDYITAIKNYDIYSQKIGRRRPEIYARALYYSGRRPESAKAYFEAARNVIILFDSIPSRHFNKGTPSYPSIIELLNVRVISYTYGIRGPFTTLEELIQFLNEEKDFLKDDEHFEDTIDYLNDIGEYQLCMDEVREKMLAVLRNKFNTIPEDVETAIQSLKNLVDLKSIMVVVTNCDTLEEVKTALRLPLSNE